jgi:hypothetical protein
VKTKKIHGRGSQIGKRTLKWVDANLCEYGAGFLHNKQIHLNTESGGQARRGT